MTVPVEKSNVLQQFIERASTLYSLPAVAMEVLDLTGKPNVDTAALRECVERDPALTAKLLRVVNSSMFGLSGEVSDLTQALTLLGVKPLKLLVLGFSLPKNLYSGVEANTLQRFWQFTLVKAVAARELCRAFWNNPGDEAFIAGLLQEIGVLVFVNELGDSYINFLSGVHERGEDLLALETATLGFDHAILSARLLDHWNLPSPIVQAVAAAQEVASLTVRETGEDVLPQTLHLATLIASIIVSNRSNLLPELLDAAQRYRGIEREQIDQLLDLLQEQVELMAGLFSVPVNRQDSYREIMARAHRQMSDAAMEVLPQMIGCGTVHEEQTALHQALDQYAQSFLAIPGAANPLKDGAPTRPSVPARSTGRTTSVPMRTDVVGSRGTTSVPSGTRSHRPDTSADPGLHGRIAAAISRCSARQSELSLVLFEIDSFEDLLLRYGPDRMVQVIAGLRRAVQMLAEIPGESVVVSDSRVALILPDCDRQQAVSLARSLNDAVPVAMLEQGDADTTISLNIGVSSLAVCSRSSRPDDLVDAADRCLFAAQRGGHVIKSIDVF